MLVYLNGSYLEHERASVPVEDRGFLFGDGVYEVARAGHGKLFEWERHLQRLKHSLGELRIGLPEPQVDALRDIALRLLERNGLTGGEATVYLQITRGAAPRAHPFPPACTPPTVLLMVRELTPLTALRARGAAAITCPDVRWARCDLKTVMLLPNVLARQQAVESGADEAIFVRDGTITEGSHTNVFAVVDEEIRTHPPSNRILPGVTRDIVIGLARDLGMEVQERPLAVQDLARATELFLTSTMIDVLPVVELDKRPIGGGRPGPVAGKLYDALASRLPGPIAAAAGR
jgi:D-alanine transaminase